MRPVARQVSGGLVLVLMAVSAAYSANAAGLRDRLPPPAARPASADAVAGPLLRSLPWWRPVAALEGVGPTRTQTFTVSDEAIQWRLSWRCADGRFRARVLAPESRRRDVVQRSPCPGSGRGYSVTSGRLALDVQADGRWSAAVEEQVDVPKVEAELPGMRAPGAQVRSTGTFYDVDRVGRGRVELHRLPDGRHVLRLVDFAVSINSDLEVQLSEASRPRTTGDVVRVPFATVAPLAATAGTMNVVVPPGVDVTAFRSVVIWCEITRNAYAAAALSVR